MSLSRVRPAVGTVAALGAFCIAPPSLAHAQAPTATDTSAVLSVVAAALAEGQPHPDSGRSDLTIRLWYIAPDDSLTARLAAAARYITAPLPAGAVCPFPDAPADAPKAAEATVSLKFMAADTAVVMLGSSCQRPRPSAVGSLFVQADGFQLVRQGGSWAITSRWYFIS